MYGIIISISILLVVLLVEKEVKKGSKDISFYWDKVFWTIIIGIIGARLYHVLDYFSFYLKNPIQIIEIYKGGLGIYGAIIFGGTYLYYSLKKHNEYILWWTDKLCLYVPLGQTLGRIANVTNHELIPVAYFEMIGTFILFGLLFFVNKSPKYSNKQGLITYLYLALYSIIRIVLEMFRTHHWLLNGINITIIVSLGVLIFSIFKLWKNFKR